MTDTFREGSRELADVSEHVDIRRAAVRDGGRLREIAVAAKGHWGYETARVREWGASLDFSHDGLSGKEMYVAETGGRIVGWAALIPRGDVCWLDDLWIEPASIGRGIGTLLFKHAVERATMLGAGRMEWEAEPNALGFYENMGGRHLRDGEPGEWGRSLVIMGIDL
jgi:GNAT superfamily N-acetyltransferase